jgi:hypothetical protein
MNRPHRPLSDFTVGNENVEYNRQKLRLQQTTNNLELITYISDILVIENLFKIDNLQKLRQPRSGSKSIGSILN